MVMVEPGSLEMNREASREEFKLWADESVTDLGPQPDLATHLRQHGYCSEFLFPHL